MIVSENGANVSSFTIALTTVPLSSVEVAFTSRFGYVSLSPSSITFDYTNYDEATTVTVSAVDDDIDRGNWYGDWIITTVSSDDSWYECDEALRPVCGQAAKYNNLTVSVMNSTIKDDDTAGVTVSKTSVSTTYNNFGNALTSGTYTIVLNSQPTDTVTVSLSGLSAYCSADDTSITFEPEDWNVPVTVTVTCTAATTDRPVCASGNRYCDGISDRMERITHTATSSDPFYDSIDISDVKVHADVVYDLTDPPRVTVARFGNLLASVSITFNRATDRAGYTGTFACSKFLGLTATQVKTYFGSGASCAFTSTSILKITFGSAATVVPYDEFAIRDLMLQTSASSASLYTMNETFKVLGPLSPTVPVISLQASSTLVGVCDNLILDGSSSSGSGGRVMTYNYSVIPGNDATRVANVSAVLDTANAQGNGKGKYRVTLLSDDMQKGGVYKFRITATNFIGEVGSSTITIKKLNVPAPDISIQGTNPYSTIRSLRMTLQASAELPTLSCVDTTKLANSKMSFMWTEETGAFTGALSGTSKNPRLLSVPVDTMDALTTYKFRVVGYMTDKPYINNSATVSVLFGINVCIFSYFYP
jgi:hypothetical protein